MSPTPATGRLCPDCHSIYYNLQAHVEECPGPMVFAGWQCSRCLQVHQRGELYCHCGGKKYPVYGIKAKA